MKNPKTIAFVLGLAAWPAAGDQNLETPFRRNGDAVLAAFAEAQQELQRSSAVIQESRRRLAYGIVISADGYVLTKASEVQTSQVLNVMIDSATYQDARIVGVDSVWDVALIKVAAENLRPVRFSTAGEPSQGSWVVTNGATSRAKRRVLAGIISANTREIPAAGGAALGLTLKEGGKSLEIAELNEKGGAAEGGLKKGDVIRAIDGRKVSQPSDVSAAIKDRKAGSVVKITIRRAGEEHVLGIRLKARGELTDDQTRNDQMSGEYSPRRTGFPRVLQHDILGARDSVGGPLVDLDGDCVGMNIARADRAQSFAIPADELREIADRLIKEVK